jgi:hypothetical protein
MIRFLVNEPACIVGKSLVIGDVHVGYDRELSESGFRVSKLTDRLVKRIKTLVEANKCKDVIILGDVKHSIELRPDLEETKRFFSELKKFTTPILVMGNHDGALNNYLDIETHDYSGWKRGKYYFSHGHANLKKEAFKCDMIFSSHLHPVVEFQDKLGGRQTERIWLRGERLTVLPAFNELLGGMDIRISDLGPLAKHFDKSELDIYLIDGLYIGKVKDLPRLRGRKMNKHEWERL